MTQSDGDEVTDGFRRGLTVGELRHNAVMVQHHLSRFIRNTGLNPGRLETDGAELLTILGTADAKQAYNRIIAVLEDLDENQYSDVLRNAFGVGYSKKSTLSERRAEWIGHMDYPISEDTIRRWEKRALEVLTRKLIASVTSDPLPIGAMSSAEAEVSVRSDTATLREEIADLRRQLEEQNRLLQEVMRRLPVGISADEDKDEFDVVLEKIGDKKMRVIAVVREIIHGLGLKEAKDLVEAAPIPLLKNVAQESAETAKERLEAAGASVSVR